MTATSSSSSPTVATTPPTDDVEDLLDYLRFSAGLSIFVLLAALLIRGAEEPLPWFGTVGAWATRGWYLPG